MRVKYRQSSTVLNLTEDEGIKMKENKYIQPSVFISLSVGGRFQTNKGNWWIKFRRKMEGFELAANGRQPRT